MKVEYNSGAYLTQIELDENYPNASQTYIRIAEFNCARKSSSPLSHISVFL